jgi:hypothetical protein
LYRRKESKMTVTPIPGNRPDQHDMSAPLETEGQGADAAPVHPNPRDEEEEAARLGDFA